MALLSDVIRSGIRAEDLTDLSPEVRKGIEPLLKFVNTGIQGLAAAFGGNVTLTDNVRSEIKTVNLDHGVAQLIYLKKLPQAKGVRSISVGSADGINQHMLARPLQLIGTTTPNQVKVLAYFADSTAVRVPVTLELTPEGNYTALTPSDGAWTNFAYSNAWVGADAAAPAGFLRDASGFVHLRGRAKSPGIAAGNSITTLPVVCRPVALKSVPTVILQAAGTWAPGQLDIGSDGTCKLYPATLVNDLFSFECINFDTRA